MIKTKTIQTKKPVHILIDIAYIDGLVQDCSNSSA